MEFFLMFALLFASFFVISHSSTSPPSNHFLTSCLIDHNVHNFTLHGKNTITYIDSLDKSIRNLRLAGPTIPKPAAIIVPKSKDELISSVLCSRKSSFQIKARSGGHTYEGTSFIAYDKTPFVVIDLFSLNKVSIDLDSETAWVEAGNTLGQTYYAISQSSRTHGFPAGTCPTVGTGGHLSGGGYGSLFRKYGLAADHIVDALFIDANGRLLDRKSMGEELFWAIRGGGGGVFGIIYAWKISLVRVPEIVTSFLVTRSGSKSYVAGLYEKWQEVAPRLDDEFYLSLNVGAGLSGTKTNATMSAVFKAVYQGRKSVAMSIMDKEFPELKLSEVECKEMTWIESALYISGLKDRSSILKLTDWPLQVYTYYKAKSDYVRTAISRTGLNMVMDILEKEPKGYLMLDPYGGAMGRISSDSIPYPHRKGNLYAIQYVVEWKDEDNENSKGYIDWIRGFYAAMAPYVSSGPRAAYINYMDFDIGVMDFANCGYPCVGDYAVEKARVWGERYFLNNYDRLVKAKTMIDPLNVFTHEQGIFPASVANGRADI